MSIENQNNTSHWKSRIQDMNEVDGKPADLGGLWTKLEARLPEKKVSHKKKYWLAAAALVACLMTVYFFYNADERENALAKAIISPVSNSSLKEIAVENKKATIPVNITVINKRPSVQKPLVSSAARITSTSVQTTSLHSLPFEAAALKSNAKPDSSERQIASNIQAPGYQTPVPLFASKKLKVIHLNELQSADADQASTENDQGFRSIRIKLMRQQAPDMSATNQSPSDNLIKIKLPQN
ncbi:MAG TPA: hypothetical protein PLC48_05580 [Ferruginibacter sp.]|nr:hypothetical protein [Ferruginibacter sp.]